MAAASEALAAKLRRAGLELVRPERGLAALGMSFFLLDATAASSCITRTNMSTPAF